MNETWWVNSSQLDNDQTDILRADPDDSLLINGPPGSGKTNILILRANYVRATHPRIVFISFTRVLSEFLKSGPSIGRADQLQREELMTFMAWGKRVLSDAGMECPPSTNQFLTDRRNLLNSLNEYIEIHNPGHLFDVVMIDEVQDFWADEIAVLKRMSTHLNAAGDSRQAIWEHKQGLPAMEKHATKSVTLHNHYRIGQKICAFADRILPPSLGGKALAVDCRYDEASRPSFVRTLPAPTVDQQFVNCINELKKQIRYITDEPILVLSLVPWN